MDKNVAAKDAVERTIEVDELLRAVELDEYGSETANLRDKLRPRFLRLCHRPFFWIFFYAIPYKPQCGWDQQEAE